MCLKGKTNLGCDGESKPSVLADAAFSKLSQASCDTRDTCDCQIATARVDFTDDANKCPALFDEIECVFNSEEAGCDSGEARHDVAAALVTLLGTQSCTASATTTCSNCIYDYAKADITSSKCSALGDLLHCLDSSSGDSCKSSGALTISTLATNAKNAIEDAANSCPALTDTCLCQYNYIIRSPSMDACDAEAQRMECLVASIGTACDDSTPRSTYAGTAKGALEAVGGCASSLSDTCTACEIQYAEASSANKANRCSALKNYYHCLDSKTATSCYGSKSVRTLASEAAGRASADNCDLGATCTCQANYLQSDFSCTALKNKMSCLAISFDDACDGSTPRNTVATTTSGAINSDCTGVTDVCECERTYAKEPFTDDGVHCSNLKTAVGCLEGKTAGGCGVNSTVSSFSTVVYQKITSIGTCSLLDTCNCQVVYLTDDISEPQLKCDALEKKQACLYLATNPTGCDTTTARKDIISSVNNELSDGDCTVPSTCQCQINYGMATVTPDTAKCTALKGEVVCLQLTDDGGCVGTTTKTRTEVATVLEDFAGSSGDCSLSDACTCQLEYGKANVVGNNKCTAQKELTVCLGKVPGDGCTVGVASHTLAITAVNVIDSLSACAPASGTTCKCQLDHAKLDRSTLPKACSAYAVLIKCLETSTGLGCDGLETKDTIATRVEDYMDLAGNNCPISNTCDCQITLAKANIDATDDKCTALKGKLICMRTTNDNACDGSTTKPSEAEATEDLLNAVGGSCSVEDTCRCEINYAKADTSSDVCTPGKSLINCMMTATEPGCASTFNNVGLGAQGIIAGGSCGTLNSSCTCQQTFAMTAGATVDSRCLAYKKLAVCLGENNDVGCTGITKISLAATVEGLIKGPSCNSGLTSTCQCQIDYAKVDTSSNEFKCSALYKELSCLLMSTGSSCDGLQAKHTLAIAVDDVATNPTLSCPAKTAACSCATVYVKTDISANVDKCNAAKVLLSCMSGVTTNGCDGEQTSNSIVGIAESAIAAVVADGDACALTESCQCEVTFGKVNPASATYCTAAVAYFACLIAVSDAGCSGKSNAELRSSALSIIDSITGCELPDTCKCQETYRVAVAGNFSQKCTFLKNGLNCLSTATSNSCDNTKTNEAVTKDFEDEAEAMTSPRCELTGTCKCQVAYGKADTSDSTSKCSAARVYRACVIAVENHQDVACDEVTQNRHILSGHVKNVLGACRGCSLSTISLFTCLLMVLVALTTKH